jgi:hypothetical protein
MAKGRVVKEEEVPHEVAPKDDGPDSIHLSATKLVVEAHYRKGKETTEDTSEKDLEVREFAVEPARVGVEFSRTQNLGNYNSVKVSVSVSVPCYREEIEDAYGYWSDYAVRTAEAEMGKYNTGDKPRAAAQDRPQTKHDF